MAEKFVLWYKLAQCVFRVYVFTKSVTASIPILHMPKDAQAFLLKVQGKMVGVAQLPSVLRTAC